MSIISDTIKNRLLLGILMFGLTTTSYALSISVPEKPCTLEQGFELAEGLVFVNYACHPRDLIPVQKSNKYGLVDHQGHIKIPLDYDSIEPFYEELALVKRENSFGYINDKNEIVIPIIYDEIGKFDREAITSVKLNGKYGYIDKSNKVVVPIQYDTVKKLSDGIIKVKNSGKYGVIALSGDMVIPTKYDEIGYLNRQAILVKIIINMATLTQKVR